MTPAAGLLIRARSLGVRVEPNGPKLRVVGPPDLPDEEWVGLTEGLAAFKPEVLAILANEAEAGSSSSWSILSGQRWGPALGDPTPGIVIDRPDPVRRAAAVLAIQSARGDAYEDDLPGAATVQDAADWLLGYLAAKPDSLPDLIAAAERDGIAEGAIRAAAPIHSIQVSCVDGIEVWRLGDHVRL